MGCILRATTLAALDDAAIGAAYTTVYTSYLPPFVMDAAAARRHVMLHDIACAHSPVWLDDDGTIVALAALGVRGDRGWIGGFGVAPSHRGQGLSHRLLQALLENARHLGLRSVWLEVLVNNGRAIQTYRRAGFTHVRDLRIFAAPASITHADAQSHRVRDAQPGTVLEQRARVTDVRPAWQREPRSIARVSGLSGLTLGDPPAHDAYVVYLASETTVHLLDGAARDVAAILPLLAALAGRLPGRVFRLSNEPDESPLSAALNAAGWEEPLRQHEMMLSL
jgi:GNAT superfamily N-acetyltransferase